MVVSIGFGVPPEAPHKARATIQGIARCGRTSASVPSITSPKGARVGAGPASARLSQGRAGSREKMMQVRVRRNLWPAALALLAAGAFLTLAWGSQHPVGADISGGHGQRPWLLRRCRVQRRAADGARFRSDHPAGDVRERQPSVDCPAAGTSGPVVVTDSDGALGRREDRQRACHPPPPQTAGRQPRRSGRHRPATGPLGLRRPGRIRPLIVSWARPAAGPRHGLTAARPRTPAVVPARAPPGTLPASAR